MTTTEQGAENMTYFTGQQIIVNPCAWDRSPAWEGEIVNYWRNGAWIVRELVHGTTVAIEGERIATY